MSDEARRKRGEALFNKVYGGVVPVPPPEWQDDFFFFTLDYLFSEVWARDSMSIRDRRLVAMGVMAAVGEAETFEIQLKAAFANNEINEDQLKDLLVFLTQYVGFPRTTRLLMAARNLLAERKK